MPSDALYDDRPGPPAKKSKLPMILGIVFGSLLLACGGGAFGLYWLMESTKEKLSSNNMKQIGLAIHNYHDTNGALPDDVRGRDGKPLLSWRVRLLPYLEEDRLFRQFNFEEAWDGPTNRPLLNYLPRVYATAAQRQGRATVGTKTYYQSFAAPGSVMAPPPQAPPGVAFAKVGHQSLATVTDGLSNTLFVVEAADPVEWTKPGDVMWDAGQPVPAFGADRGGSTFLALFGDARVTPVKKSVSPDQLKAVITVAGREPATPLP